MNRFDDLPLLPFISKSLNTLGFTTPTEVQAKAIPHLLTNPTGDIHAQAQTGTGKTLAFGIPLLHAIDQQQRRVQALIVAPTRELVVQIYENLKEVSQGSGIALEVVYGGMSMERQISGIRRGAQIIVGTPGRLNDHLRRRTLSLDHLKVLVLDEADIMLDMGFKEEVDEILKSAPDSRAIWLFSATVRSGIKQLIQSHMRDVMVIRATAQCVVSGQVKQHYCVVPPRKRVDVIARFIEASPDFYGILFCQTKILASEVMEQLVARGFRANCLHGDMSQALRNQVIRGFKNKDFSVLVATDVAARGIDVSDLTHVINYSLPMEHESYIHRVGRTGRAGKEGTSIVFISPSEMHKLRRLEKAAKTTLEEIFAPSLDAVIKRKMDAVADFIEQAKEPNKKLSPVHKPIHELIQTFSEQELRNSLAIALEDRFFKDMVYEKLERFEPLTESTSIQEICIEAGLDDGIKPEQVEEHVCRVCKLATSDIQKLRVLSTKTFIVVPQDRLAACLNALREHPITEKKPKVHLVYDDRRDGSGGGRSGGGRSRRPMRERRGARGGDARDGRDSRYGRDSRSRSSSSSYGTSSFGDKKKKKGGQRRSNDAGKRSGW